MGMVVPSKISGFLRGGFLATGAIAGWAAGAAAGAALAAGSEPGFWPAPVIGQPPFGGGVAAFVAAALTGFGLPGAVAGAAFAVADAGAEGFATAGLAGDARTTSGLGATGFATGCDGGVTTADFAGCFAGIG